MRVGDTVAQVFKSETNSDFISSINWESVHRILGVDEDKSHQNCMKMMLGGRALEGGCFHRWAALSDRSASSFSSLPHPLQKAVLTLP